MNRYQFVDARMKELQAEAAKNYPNYPDTSLSSMPADFGFAVADFIEEYPFDGVASTTMMSANVDFQLLEYTYGTGEPMRAYIEDMPKNGLLKLQLSITPSGHNGIESAVRWAQTNTYQARVGYLENGRFQELDSTHFDSDGNETQQRQVQVAEPNYAPTSPDLEVDLHQFRKDHPGKELVLEGWPYDSAGVGGYIEARRTIIDVNV